MHVCSFPLWEKTVEKPWQNVLNDGLHAEEEEEEVAFLFRVHHKRGNTS